MKGDKGIRLESVTVEYPRTTALRAVDLAVDPGELVAVTGPSGAGKTTLLWTVSGLVTPDHGTVRVGGIPADPRRVGPDRGVMLIPQGNGLASILTARENIVVALLAIGVEPGEAADCAEDVLRQVGIEDHADHLVEELSGGQQQRAAVARGLAMGAAVLLADEVTSDLDSGNRDLVLRLLRAEADRGAVVLLATHDPEAAAVCDREMRLVDGMIASAGSSHHGRSASSARSSA